MKAEHRTRLSAVRKELKDLSTEFRKELQERFEARNNIDEVVRDLHARCIRIELVIDHLGDV
jgi:uncharacterized protein involved in exopolysaccharide biosynthesis